ncbi:MAG: lysophospholipid acyltransferase family protein [Muribaculaceae bacterium]|nr:lysophospholipid acyltransferase family protein [Muribaculaceae bacterium]
MSLGGKALHALFRGVGSLPLWMLYGLADILTFMAGRVIGYRRGVIRRNIDSSFPEKNLAERRGIERQFYRFLGDYFVETLRLGGMSRKVLGRRMRFENVEEVDSCLRQGRDVVLYLGHYCNWEWISSIPLHHSHTSDAGKSVRFGQIYHPLENRAFDEAFLAIRGRCGAVSIPMADTLGVLRGWRRAGEPFIVGFISDQAPILEGIHYFADFLNHPETPTYTGAERIARMFDAAVFYCDIRREKRGHYVCRYERMTDAPKSMPTFALSQMYYDLLARSIRRQPPYWLWSHNRWKRTRRDFEAKYGDEARRRLERL